MPIEHEIKLNPLKGFATNYHCQIIKGILYECCKKCLKGRGTCQPLLLISTNYCLSMRSIPAKKIILDSEAKLRSIHNSCFTAAFLSTWKSEMHWMEILSYFKVLHDQLNLKSTIIYIFFNITLAFWLIKKDSFSKGKSTFILLIS
jgi:hypothetical protein